MAPSATISGTSCGGRAVGQGEEDRVGGRAGRRRRGAVVEARWGWICPIGSSSRPRPTSPTIVDGRMAVEEPDELGADVAGRTDDRRPGSDRWSGQAGDPPRPSPRRSRSRARPAARGRPPRSRSRGGSPSWTHDYTRTTHSHATVRHRSHRPSPSRRSSTIDGEADQPGTNSGRRYGPVTMTSPDSSNGSGPVPMTR